MVMNKYEANIKELKEICDLLQKQNDLKESVIKTQERQITILTDKITTLEKNNNKLIDAGNEWEQTCNHLEEICIKQQVLLDSYLEDESNNY